MNTNIKKELLEILENENTLNKFITALYDSNEYNSNDLDYILKHGDAFDIKILCEYAEKAKTWINTSYRNEIMRANKYLDELNETKKRHIRWYNFSVGALNDILKEHHSDGDRVWVYSANEQPTIEDVISNHEKEVRDDLSYNDSYEQEDIERIVEYQKTKIKETIELYEDDFWDEKYYVYYIQG